MSSKETILLTGATGNVGGVILEHILSTTSHNVNVVVRNATKHVPLFHERYPKDTSSGRLQFTTVPDMTVQSAFDTAVASASKIIHCATPVGSLNNDWENGIFGPLYVQMGQVLTFRRHDPSDLGH
jgi:uncharacterized protein YbjT (DUF2867 family)